MRAFTAIPFMFAALSAATPTPVAGGDLDKPDEPAEPKTTPGASNYQWNIQFMKEKSCKKANRDDYVFKKHGKEDSGCIKIEHDPASWNIDTIGWNVELFKNDNCKDGKGPVELSHCHSAAGYKSFKVTKA